MPTRRVTIRLHPIQAAFRRSDAVYRAMTGGVGSGKSWVGAYDLIRRAQPNRLYMVVAPTYPMLRDASLRTFMEHARSLDYLRSFNKSEMAVVLGNGAEVLFRSADDPDRLRGPNLSGVWMDEASLMRREAYDVLIGRLREHGEQGWLSATFTPKGRSHWTYEIFATGRPNTAFYVAPTRVNPFRPEGFVELLRQTYPGPLARQELEGEFVDVEGAEWPASYFPEDMWFDAWPKDLVLKTIAVDPSKGKDARHGDYSATVLLGRCREGRLWCEAFLYRQNAEELIATILDAQQEFRADVIAVEANQFQELLAVDLLKAAQKRGMPVPVVPIVNNVPKIVRIRRIGPYLAQRSIRFRATEGTRMMVQQMRDFPVGEHDDGPDSLEGALRAMIELWNGRTAQKGRTAYNRVGV